MLAPRKLEDSEAAEQYCAEIGRADAYMQFVSIYPSNILLLYAGVV